MNINIKQEIEKYISENIIKTLSFIALLFGGLVFFIYYLDIRYLPELNIISSVQLLTFASVTGFLLVFSTTTILIFPGIYWLNSIQSSFNQVAKWSVVKINKTIWFVLPIISIYLALICFIAISVKYPALHWFYKLTVPIIIILIWILLLWWQSSRKSPISKKAPISKQILNKKYSNFAILSFISSFISIYPIFMFCIILLRDGMVNIEGFVFKILCIATIVIVANSIIINKPNDISSIYWYSILGLLSLLIAIYITEQTATFPRVIMNIYKLGNIEASSVILDKQGCLEVNKSMKHHEAKDKKDQIIQYEIEDETCIISNMNILSRIGKESYVQINKINIEEGKGEKDNIRFPVPSSSIKRWNLINQ